MKNPAHLGSTSPRLPEVYIIILNWNGWSDTIECLESVFRLDYANFSVVVCDNDSSDGSMEQIRRWAVGDVMAGCANPSLQSMTMPPVTKPIPYRTLDTPSEAAAVPCNEMLLLIQTGGNLGFAGGNNVGLRYALAQQDCDFVWLLNNDTVVDPNALLAMVERMQQGSDAGICGSTLMYYHEPRAVQALGGSVYNRWTARGGHLGAELDCSRTPSREWVESRLEYVVGASMLVRRQFIEQVGLMSEAYFLYFEEIDWATRGKGMFALAYAPNSVVYHKEGASIGTARRAALQSTTTEYYATRNRILFTMRFYPFALPSVAAAICVSVVHRLIHGRIENAFVVLRSCFDLACGFSKRPAVSAIPGKAQTPQHGRESA